MDLAVRASIFKWFSTRVKHVEIKLDEKKEELWTWTKKPKPSKKKTKNAIVAGD
jgi:hypothetical protein